MFTTIESEWGRGHGRVKAASDAILATAPRCILVLEADIRPGFTDAMTSRVETVERNLAAE